MNARTNAKAREITQYASELEGILPNTLEEYTASLEKKAACERYVEKIVEAIVDLAFLTIKDKGLAPPEDDGQAFDILAREGIIPSKLADNLKRAKGMRNVIVHQYGGVNDEMVFDAIRTELIKDAKIFVRQCRKHS